MVRISVGRVVVIFIGTSLGIGVIVEVEIGEDGEVGIYVGGWVSSMHFRCFGKDVKCRVNVIIYNSVGWGVYIVVGTWFCRGVDGEVKILKV